MIHNSTEIIHCHDEKYFSKNQSPGNLGTAFLKDNELQTTLKAWNEKFKLLFERKDHFWVLFPTRQKVKLWDGDQPVLQSCQLFTSWKWDSNINLH